MKKIVLIFDYFKEAFHINKKNKTLYKPQIALIAVKVLLMLLVGIGVYSWIGVGNINAVTAMRPDEIFRFMLSQGFKLLAILLAYALISVIVESGLLNMYKKVVTQGYTGPGDFKEGLSKYFLKLLLGQILIVLCYIPLLPIILILGIVTLTVGLTVIPIVIGVFLTMWKISLVMNDIGIFAAAKDSFNYAKRNFIPLAVLQIIHWSFIQAAGGGSGGGSGNISNINNYNNMNNDLGQGFNNNLFPMPDMEEVIKVIKIIFAILLPIISIAIILGSIIAMIFEVFFSLTLFVAYKNDFKVTEKQTNLLEVPTEVKAQENYEALETTVVDEINDQADEEGTDIEEVSSNKEVEQ